MFFLCPSKDGPKKLTPSSPTLNLDAATAVSRENRAALGSSSFAPKAFLAGALALLGETSVSEDSLAASSTS